MATDDWYCPHCGTTDEALRYPSGTIPKCKDCMRFANMKANSRRERRHVHQPELMIAEAAFREWRKSQALQCRYCGIEEERLAGLELHTLSDYPLVALGVDRIWSGDYELGNIALCCFICNRIKADIFTEEEMRRTLGPAIRVIWEERLVTNQKRREASPQVFGVSGGSNKPVASRHWLSEEFQRELVRSARTDEIRPNSLAGS